MDTGGTVFCSARAAAKVAAKMSGVGFGWIFSSSSSWSSATSTLSTSSRGRRS